MSDTTNNTWTGSGTSAGASMTDPNGQDIYYTMSEAGYWTSFGSNVTLPTSTAYVISTNLYLSSTTTNNGAGLDLGQSDGNNFYGFDITINGQYRIDHKSNGVRSVVQDFTTSSAINTGSAWNQLQMFCVQGKDLFVINGIPVYQCAALSFPGSWFGIRVWGPQTVEFSSFGITTTSSALTDLSVKRYTRATSMGYLSGR
jgi:hypothetical protein